MHIPWCIMKIISQSILFLLVGLGEEHLIIRGIPLSPVRWQTLCLLSSQKWEQPTRGGHEHCRQVCTTSPCNQHATGLREVNKVCNTRWSFATSWLQQIVEEHGCVLQHSFPQTSSSVISNTSDSNYKETAGSWEEHYCSVLFYWHNLARKWALRSRWKFNLYLHMSWFYIQCC